MARPLSEVLTDLIGLAQEVITRPTRFAGFHAGEVITELAREIRHADSLPAEGPRTTRAGLVMVIALEEFLAGDREATSPMLALAGSVLPWLRGEAWLAVRNEKEAGASDGR